ncbi:uncharacterized protein FIESC28_09510 [Fusarium coffeatum]|uniref:Uncharacterized protein n=1 Tax=Fusarium coffeatum TaxID=231269 RepID=A0A366R1C3_9HYPO|nr:uncharacterized protein FIESC28_09510 [Fusarium coffeatum]RBR10308.1 hypothetical protein FIESC28_09510 [Fusarium coffeatum]
MRIIESGIDSLPFATWKPRQLGDKSRHLRILGLIKLFPSLQIRHDDNQLTDLAKPISEVLCWKNPSRSWFTAATCVWWTLLFTTTSHTNPRDLANEVWVVNNRLPKLMAKPDTGRVNHEKVFTYDLEKNFIQAIEQMMEGKGDLEKLKDEYPEAEFLLNLKKPLIEHQIRIPNYTNAVANKLQDSQWVLQYHKLAESRRCMFRLMPKLFRQQHPLLFSHDYLFKVFEAMIVTNPWLEMTEEGTVQEILKESAEILTIWLGSLAGNDPDIIPKGYQGLKHLSDITDVMKERLENDHPALPVPLLLRPSTMRMAYRRSIAITNPETKERPHSCPFLADKHLTSQHPAISA